MGVYAIASANANYYLIFFFLTNSFMELHHLMSTQNTIK